MPFEEEDAAAAVGLLLLILRAPPTPVVVGLERFLSFWRRLSVALRTSSTLCLRIMENIGGGAFPAAGAAAITLSASALGDADSTNASVMWRSEA